MSYTIVVGNKNYSSWSMRAWLVIDHFGLDYEEDLVPLDEADTRARLLAYSPAGKVPTLIDRGRAVWDSLAIIEYLAERHPDLPIWPADPMERALARSLSAEMHSGFQALRSACPMNLRKTFPFRRRGGRRAERDVARIEALIGDRIARSGGPFLFGEWGAVDAMYAPVTARLTGYSWPVSKVTLSYCAAVQQEASYRRWYKAGVVEPWVIPADEVK
ncbi:glutathione S-transferase family protein [Acuticoccus mangrovi]|uniref:Glutathione S-transferase family protein n=1 Tax=Acuticoccus mangrovi TaxID=2796142 RepID=A0A934IRG1_9HYPH|nr:glutathione S-transferase family protein [Acuticoccus mangrovi]